MESCQDTINNPRVTTAKDRMTAQEKKVQREMDKAVDKFRRHCDDEDRDKRISGSNLKEEKRR